MRGLGTLWIFIKGRNDAMNSYEIYKRIKITIIKYNNYFNLFLLEFLTMFILNSFCCVQNQSSESTQPRVRSVKALQKEDRKLSFETCPSNNANTEPQSYSGLKAKEAKLNDDLEITQSVARVSEENLQNLKRAQSFENRSLLKKQSQKGNGNQVELSEQIQQESPKLRKIDSQNLRNLQFIDLDVRNWSVKNVLKFLNKIGFQQYQNSFYENKVKGKDLISLKQEQLLNDLKMTKNDSKLLELYIKLLSKKTNQSKAKKSTVKIQSQVKLSKKFHSLSTNTSSHRKVLTLFSNPIIEESDENTYEEQYTSSEIALQKLYSTQGEMMTTSN